MLAFQIKESVSPTALIKSNKNLDNFQNKNTEQKGSVKVIIYEVVIFYSLIYVSTS